MRKIFVLALCIVALAALAACDKAAATEAEPSPIANINAEQPPISPEPPVQPPKPAEPVAPIEPDEQPEPIPPELPVQQPSPLPSDDPSVGPKASESNESAMISQEYPAPFEADDIISVEDFNAYVQEYNSPFTQDSNEASWSMPTADGLNVVVRVHALGDRWNPSSWGIAISLMGNGLQFDCSTTYSTDEYHYSMQESTMSGFLARKIWDALALSEDVETYFDAKLALDCTSTRHEYKSIKDIPLEVLQNEYSVGTLYEIPPWAK